MTWSPRNRCGERKDSEGYSDDEDDEEMDPKADDVIKTEEKDSFRMTTVIKSPEGKYIKYQDDCTRWFNNSYRIYSFINEIGS